MLGRMAVLAASIALAGCANMESAGRNAQRAPAPPAMADEAPAPRAQTAPPVQTPAPTPTPARAPALTTPPPQQQAQLPAPQQQAQAAAPAVTVPTPPPRRVDADETDADIVVPGQREQQVRPPSGDPRSTAERAEDVRAWDRCVVEVQSAFESDPMRPSLESPEEHCRQSLGMRNRTAVPESRRR